MSFCSRWASHPTPPHTHIPQAGNQHQDTVFYSVEIDRDGAIVLMGSTSGNWAGGGGGSGSGSRSRSRSGPSRHTPSGSQDFAAVKLEAGGKEVWRFQARKRGRFFFFFCVGGVFFFFFFF